MAEGNTMETQITPNDDNYADEYRIVLIGKTGSGKSKTGNTLIGENVFRSMVSSESITSKCKLEEGSRNGKKLLVVDTPGLYDTRMEERDVLKELARCVGLTTPGPHAFVLVLSIGRLTEEEHKSVEKFVFFFGEKILSVMIVLFTRRDDLEEGGVDLKEYIKTLPPKLLKLLKDCDNRYIAFNNRAGDEQKQVQVDDFLTMVNEMNEKNGPKFYTDEIYQGIEKRISAFERDAFRKDIEEGRISAFMIIVEALKAVAHKQWRLLKQLLPF